MIMLIFQPISKESWTDQEILPAVNQIILEMDGRLEENGEQLVGSPKPTVGINALHLFQFCLFTKTEICNENFRKLRKVKGFNKLDI